MNIAHPQLPIKRDGHHSTQAYTYIRIGGANGKMFALVNEGEIAALIVRAVNAHDTMREALENSIDILKRAASRAERHGQPFIQEEIIGVLRQIEAALALASGTREGMK